ncbi:hypothetical protein N9121_00750 [Pseudomonadales bacterium]|nr:hypothetical protein [Pseudomonadales bacterium]
MTIIDTNFNFFSDTPIGKDPDSFSPTLRKYHGLLWSKKLPAGDLFRLNLETPRLLHHKSDLGEFYLSSDAIGHTFKAFKKMSHIIENIPLAEVDDFFSICCTIGAYIIFPSKRVDGKMTINSARGCNQKIMDRFDLTLECIRLHYLDEVSPLSDTLKRYSSFFSLFINFKDYVDFFLLQDLLIEGESQIKFWHPFGGFDKSPLPQNINDYHAYRLNVIDFIQSRNIRIENNSKKGLTFS